MKVTSHRRSVLLVFQRHFFLGGVWDHNSLVSFKANESDSFAHMVQRKTNFTVLLHGYRESIIIISMAIRSFGDTATADLYHGRNSSRVRRFPQNIVSAALRKLDILNAAHKLDDLRSPPGNRLEALKGDLEGFHSIRVNDQWRITFRWNDGVQDVSLLDYH